MLQTQLSFRCLSSLKAEREKASSILKGPSETRYSGDKKAFVESIRKVKLLFICAKYVTSWDPILVQALYASKIVSYAQGFMLLRQAAKEFGWNLNYGGIALMWRGGCIIRSRYFIFLRICLTKLESRFLGNIKAAFDKNPSLDNLLLDDFFRDAIHNCQVKGIP